MSNKLTQELNLPVILRELLMLHTFPARNSLKYYLPKLEVTLHLCDGTQTKLGLKVMDEMTSELNICFKNKDGALAANQFVKPGVLIGVDYYWELIDLNLDKTSEGLYVVPTKLEKAITGKIEECDAVHTTNMVACYDVPDAVESFWNLKTLGITDPPNTVDDDEALKQFHQTLEFRDNRYIVSWPYRNFTGPVSDNYFLCYSRLKSVLN
ncbi:unnamed protein product [Enterobius vermicularis]|uniref:DUF1758 domain-containing protein n=1 Tax=Enterobius vermicularis TaxID=51028 RepID=A0A0N4UT87_ENTVE|nr:unnamed protein product [Enterobius vermicularis]